MNPAHVWDEDGVRESIFRHETFRRKSAPMSGFNSLCPKCGETYSTMCGSLPYHCDGVPGVETPLRWHCPIHNVNYGGPREAAKKPKCCQEAKGGLLKELPEDESGADDPDYGLLP